MRAARMKVLGLVVVLLAGLLVAGSSGPAQAMGVKMTGPQLRAWAIGKHVGPNSYTDGGKKTITGFTYVRTTRNGTRIWRIHSKITHPAPCLVCMGPVVQLNSWYDPRTWDWGGIFGKVWDRIQDCASGALAGFVTTASGSLLANLMAKATVVKAGGPYGYAAIMIGGCTWGAVSGGS